MGIFNNFFKTAKAYHNKNLKNSRLRPMTTSSPSIPERDMNTADRRKAMTTARQAIEENPIAMSMMITGVDNVVGTGYNLRMLTSNKDYNVEVERRFQAQSESKLLDVRGLRTFGDIQRMWWMRRAIDGDVGAIKKISVADDGMVLTQAQTIEADRIRKTGAHTVDDVGIDYDSYGKALQYWVGPRVEGLLDVQAQLENGIAVAAKDFIFYPFDGTQRTERKRGMTMFLQDFNLLKDFQQVMDAMLQKVKNEAFIGLNFQMDGATDGKLFGDSEVQKDDPDGKTRRHVKMIAGMTIHSQPGEKVDVLGTKSPHGDWIDFMRLILRLMGSPLALPLEMFFLDFNDTNFSGGRAIIEIAKRHFRVEQRLLESPSNEFFMRWLENEIKFNGLVVPSDVAIGTVHKWGKPGWPYLDPKKDVEAQALQIANGLTTRQRILDETTGEDWTDIAQGLAAEQELLKELGVPIAIGQPGNTVSGGSDETKEDKDDDIEGDK